MLKTHNILLVETGTHYSVFRHLYSMLLNKFNVDGYYPYKEKIHIDGINGKIEYYKFHPIFIYYKLIYKAYSYDYIYLVTGPQYMSKKNGWIILIGYIAYIIIHGKKTILQIRDNSYFTLSNIKDVYKIYQIIRKWSIFKVRLIAFENNNLQKNFLNKVSISKLKCFTSYVYYSDIDINTLEKEKIVCSDIMIGLLGAFDENRRDYLILIEAFKLLAPESRERIIIINLGYLSMSKNIEMISKFINVVKFECREGYISDSKLEELSSKCSFFISPLKNDLGYGMGKGTGSIGDAIRFRKKLIIPQFSDITGEFSKFCYYYNDAKTLSNLIIKLSNNTQKKEEEYFDIYNSKVISLKLHSIIGKDNEK